MDFKGIKIGKYFHSAVSVGDDVIEYYWNLLQKWHCYVIDSILNISSKYFCDWFQIFYNSSKGGSQQVIRIYISV